MCLELQRNRIKFNQDNIYSNALTWFLLSITTSLLTLKLWKSVSTKALTCCASLHFVPLHFVSSKEQELSFPGRTIANDETEEKESSVVGCLRLG